MTNKAFKTDIADLANELHHVSPQTPLQFNAYLSEKHNAEIFLKREDLTPVRSYKIRGAFSAMRKQILRGMTRFACASAGNHAQGVAYMAAHFGVHAVIYMPTATPGQKINKTKIFGRDAIEIVLEGDYFDETLASAKAYAQANGAYFLAPFDDEDVIDGQATIGYELEQELDVFDDLVLPVGGGGLSAGLVKYFGSGTRIPNYHFVEPMGASSLYESLRLGKAQPLPRVDSFVDGAAVAQIGEINFDFLRKFAPEQVTRVPENRLSRTMIEMLNVEGIVLEPAGALAIDALQDLNIAGRRIVVIVSGGNFDFERLPDVKERGMRYDGTKKYIILRLPQRPGALRDFLNLLGPNDDIARFEYIKKSARQFGTVLLGLETNDPKNFPKLFSQLGEAGFHFTDITDNEEIGALLI